MDTRLYISVVAQSHPGHRSGLREANRSLAERAEKSSLAAVILTSAPRILKEFPDCEDQEADPIDQSSQDGGKVQQRSGVIFAALLNEDPPG